MGRQVDPGQVASVQNFTTKRALEHWLCWGHSGISSYEYKQELKNVLWLPGH